MSLSKSTGAPALCVRLNEKQLTSLLREGINIRTTRYELKVKDIVSEFCPSPRHFEELRRVWPERYAEITQELKLQPAKYQVPQHQRLYAWNNDMARDFVRSLILDFPIHDIIATKNGDVYIEDGQHRLTAIWRFMLNLYAYSPDGQDVRVYYNAIPPCDRENKNVYTLASGSCEIRSDLNSRTLGVKEAKGLDNSHRAQVFDYTNRGKALTDADRFWAFVGDNPFMNFVKAVCLTHGETLFEPHLGYGWELIEHKRRALIHNLVGVVGALVAPSGKDMDVINGQMRNAHSVLGLKNSEIPKERVKAGLRILSNVYSGLSDSKGLGWSKTWMRKPGATLGQMLIQMRENPEVFTDSKEADRFTAFWIKVINKIRESLYLSSLEGHWYQPFAYNVGSGATRGNHVTGSVVKSRLDSLIVHVEQNFGMKY